MAMTATELFVCTDVSLGMLVRLERVRRGMRQSDVASQAGVTQAEVSALERGLPVPPSVSARILTALDLRVKEGTVA